MSKRSLVVLSVSGTERQELKVSLVVAAIGLLGLGYWLGKKR